MKKVLATKVVTTLQASESPFPPRIQAPPPHACHAPRRRWPTSVTTSTSISSSTARTVATNSIGSEER